MWDKIWKKKVWELLAKKKSVYVLETPQCKDRIQAQNHYIQELKDLILKLEKLSGKKLDLDKLKNSMELIQKKREQIRRVYNTRKIDPPPISGKDSLLISQIAFYDDPNRQIEMVGKLADELEVPIDITWSCYGDFEEPCGKCSSCLSRQIALKSMKTN